MRKALEVDLNVLQRVGGHKLAYQSLLAMIAMFHFNFQSLHAFGYQFLGITLW